MEQHLIILLVSFLLGFFSKFAYDYLNPSKNMSYWEKLLNTEIKNLISRIEKLERDIDKLEQKINFLTEKIEKVILGCFSEQS